MMIPAFSSISPSLYEECAVLARTVGMHMLEQLDFVKIAPRVMLDLGCGPGQFSAALTQRYPDAALLVLDLSLPMLKRAREHADALPIQADALHLPFCRHSVDLIFANLLFPWCSDPERLLQECFRVLKPGGLLLFSALGPDTLKEVAVGAGDVAMPALIDMHHVGDALLRAGFVDPVVDAAYVTLKYQKEEKLINECQATGMLAGTDFSLEKDAEGVFLLTFEVIHAHAWGALQAEAGIVKIPLSHLRRFRE